MEEHESFVDHIRVFKRRRRRCGAGASLLLAFCSLSRVSTFIPLPLRCRTASFYTTDSIDEIIRLAESRRRPQVIQLRNAETASSRNAKEGSNEGKSYQIPPEQLEMIKESVDIVSVVESYGLPGFRRHGTNRAQAICPFHDDHNPSLSIDGQRGIYKCFACGAGGDVFNFVREYSALESERMTFYQAVRHVAQEFGDPNMKLDFVSSSTSRMSDEARQALNEKKNRLLLANAAAAAFYAKCLITLPAAGVARSHMRERGLSPTTVKAFAMGYAPDAFFRVKGEWGKGSLVQHLRELEITPTEMIEAGLATRTKGAQWKASQDDNTTNHEMNDADDDYSTLIDRFRNRLVVPIFDSRGANVLGFGARILPPEETDSNGYRAPKYINSPESLVFQKRNALFGQHYAKEAVRAMQTNVGSDDFGRSRGCVVIVEGYMDAILLWEAGVREVVASMGTALTMEQLSNAARTAGTHGGRIVLIFDGDEAGLNAIERLCTGTLLSKTAETYVVEILVATLPDNVKDPGEYIESISSKNKARSGDHFRKQVIDTSKDWSTWYLDTLLSRYDETALRGTTGSFADICDRISDFLSRFSNPAERTKRAHDVAGSLADIVSGKAANNGSNSLRMQLETDLVNMVSRKAGARESIERRIESVEGYSKDATQKLARMTGGDGVNTFDDSSKKLSNHALRALNKSDSPLKPSDGANDFNKVKTRQYPFDKEGTFDGSGRRKRGRMQRRTAKTTIPPLTPHFSGFDFINPTDVDWLNIPREKWRRKKRDLTLGTALDGGRYASARTARLGEDHIPGLFSEDLVYFNSNSYHGEHFVTEDAVFAGYSNGETTRDAAIFEHGVGTLVRQDVDTLVNAAERKLLRNIVHFERARMAMRHALATGDATGSRNRIEWSQPERAWLFERLVEQTNTIPKELMVDGRTKELHLHLANLHDRPLRAFGELASAGSDTSSDSFLSPGRPTLTESFKAISDTDIRSAIDISSLIEPMNTPSDSDDIESWAASYDSTLFGDESPVVDLEESVDKDQLSAIGAESVNQESGMRIVDAETYPGCLDEFFASEEDLFATTYDVSVPREFRAELEVQEAHAMLLRASALQRVSVVTAEWLAVGRLLSARQEQVDTTFDENRLPEMEEAKSKTDSVIDPESMSLDALKEYFRSVVCKMRDMTETVYHLDVSAKRIGSRLLDYSNADGIEGRLSIAQQEELATMIDRHVKNLPEGWKAPEITDVNRLYRSHNNRDPSMGWGDDYSLERVECFEDDMAQIADDWGEWADDDFVWSPEDNNFGSPRLSGGAASNVPNILDNYELEARIAEEDESLEDALFRLDSEWADWDHVHAPAPSADTETDEVLSADLEEAACILEHHSDEGKGDEDSAEPGYFSVFE